MDYAFLQEEIVEMEDGSPGTTRASVSMTILVMIETLCESVWANSVHVKGDRSYVWLPGKCERSGKDGVANTRVVIKTDTEPAIVDLRRAVGASRGGTPTGYDDSRVGDYNSTGKVERTIREVKGRNRTL